MPEGLEIAVVKNNLDSNESLNYFGEFFNILKESLGISLKNRKENIFEA